MSKGVRISDDKWPAIKARLAALRATSVTVGIHASDPNYVSPAGKRTSLAVIASVHEFGSKQRRIPARPFIRPTVDHNREKYFARLEQVIRIALKSAAWPRAVAALGLGVESDIRRRIRTGIAPPLSERTIEAREAKRGRKPGNSRFSGWTALIDTGRLIGSIRYVAETRGSVFAEGRLGKVRAYRAKRGKR